jgi:cytochrome P450 family 6
MKLMFDIIDNIGDNLVLEVEKDLKLSSEVDMRNFCQYFTNDNIGNVAFGHEYKTLENRDSIFLRHGRRLFNPTLLENFKLLFGSVAPEISRMLKFRFTPKEAGDFFHQSFLDTLEQREKSQVKRNDFVQLLLGLRNLYTPSELAAEAFLVYTGGYETSSTLMQFTLYELALNEDMQDRLRDEINQEIEDNENKLTYDSLFGMKYLDMVVNESLRKYPPIPNSFRRSTKDYKIPDTNLVIPKGTFTVINTFSLHRDSEYYPEPEKFNPERFSDENIKNIVPYTFLPFGEGPRNCLGMRFGLMQAKLGIVKLIKNFKLSICDKSPVPLNFVPAAPFLTPVGGMILRVERVL